MGGIMGKANALKAKAAETAAAAGAGNLQVSVEIFLKRSEGRPRVGLSFRFTIMDRIVGALVGKQNLGMF